MSRKCSLCPIRNTSFCHKINPWARKYSAADKRRIVKNALKQDRYYVFELISQKSSLIESDRVAAHAYASKLNRANPSERWIVCRM